MATKVDQVFGGSFEVSNRYTKALTDDMTRAAITALCDDLNFNLRFSGHERHAVELAKQFLQGRRLLLESSDLGKILNSKGKRQLWAVSGYFQDQRALEGQIKLVAQLMRSFIDANVKSKQREYIALHIRLGDYQDMASLYGNLSANYYSTALEILRQDGLSYGLPIVLVSDDRDGARQIVGEFMSQSDFELAPLATSPMEDLAILSKAKYLIAPNSTFSWWASQIGNTQRIFLPKPFLLDAKKNKKLNLSTANSEFLDR
jgi:hypothetical protein